LSIIKEKLRSHHKGWVAPSVVYYRERNQYHIHVHLSRVSTYLTRSWVYYWLHCYSSTTGQYFSKLLTTNRTTCLFLCLKRKVLLTNARYILSKIYVRMDLYEPYIIKNSTFCLRSIQIGHISTSYNF